MAGLIPVRKAATCALDPTLRGWIRWAGLTSHRGGTLPILLHPSDGFVLVELSLELVLLQGQHRHARSLGMGGRVPFGQDDSRLRRCVCLVGFRADLNSHRSARCQTRSAVRDWRGGTFILCRQSLRPLHQTGRLWVLTPGDLLPL